MKAALDIRRGLSDINHRFEELALPSMYWEEYQLSLRFRLHRFDSHLRQHTVQVDKALVEIGQAPTEARRLLRLIYAALAAAFGAISARADEIAGVLASET